MFLTKLKLNFFENFIQTEYEYYGAVRGEDCVQE